MNTKKVLGSKRILAREEFCMGCRLCETWCVVAHSGSRDIIKTFQGRAALPEPAILVEEKEHVSFAIQCRHCDNAPCIDACPTGAMHRDPATFSVLHDKERCVGCWMCIMTCPYGVIKPDLGRKKVASKCDLCTECGEPACVKHCPNGALVLIDDKTDIGGKKRR